MAAKTKFYPNLHWRLPILVGLSIIITAAVLTWLLVNLERRTFSHEFQTSLLHQGRAIARTLSSSAIRDNPEEGVIQTLVSAKEDNPYLNGAYFFSDGGEIYSADEEIVPLSVEGEPIVLDSLRTKEELRGTEEFFYLSLPVLSPASAPGELTTIGELRLELSVEPVRQALEESTRRGVFTGMAALVLITALSVLVFLRALRPLKELRRGVKQLGAGNFSYRLKVKAKNEFGLLASAFNDMAERLENLHGPPKQNARIARDLEIARQLQRSYLPKEPPIYRGVNIAGFCEPAYEVGGDYYDFIPIDDRRLGVLVADVSGKSLQGLMIMLMLRTILRSTVPRHFDARPTLCETNTILSPDMRTGNFVTCVYYVYDSRNRSLDVVNAGHNPLLVHHRDENEVEVVKTRGRPLGLIEPEEFYRTLESTTVQLNPGDTVLIYTDGITESMNDRMELFGEQRLQEAFTMFAELKPEELVKKLAETVHAFVGDAKKFDDMTLVALQIEKTDAEKTPKIDLAEEVSSTVDRYLSESGV
ncbi:SpoIIE family protein phosphatase [bacterium]|nr:SpoIIE family protein phosphatase [bacterium]